MQSITERNRAIKRTLESAFGRGKVKVRGSRGTGIGYVHVAIDWTPLDSEQYREMVALCKQLLQAARIDLGRRYTDDTCLHVTDECAIRMNPPRFYRTMRLANGKLATMANEYGAEWQTAECAA
jgi:hypothetical protein